MKKLINFFKDEDGLETSEYAVMGALIILGLVGAVGLLRDEIVTAFGNIKAVIAKGNASAAG